MDISSISTRSLALQAIDGCLYFEGMVNGRRNFGQNISETNINEVLDNTCKIIWDLKEKNVVWSYRYWMWYLKACYDPSIPVRTHLHIPVLNYSLRLIPELIYQRFDWLAEEFGITPKAIKTVGYNTFLEMTNYDGLWLQHEDTEKIEVFTVELSTYVLVNTKIRDIFDVISCNVLDEIFNESDTYDEMRPLKQSEIYEYERRTISDLLSNDYELLSLLYLTRFFPDVIKNSYSDKMSIQAFDKVFKMPVLQRHTYELLKWGVPAIYNLFGLKYPTDPIVQFTPC